MPQNLWVMSSELSELEAGPSFKARSCMHLRFPCVCSSRWKALRSIRAGSRDRMVSVAQVHKLITAMLGESSGFAV